MTMMLDLSRFQAKFGLSGKFELVSLDFRRQSQSWLGFVGYCGGVAWLTLRCKEFLVKLWRGRSEHAVDGPSPSHCILATQQPKKSRPGA